MKPVWGILMMIGMGESGRDSPIPEMVWKRVTERKRE
jgi:hypothetical protein